MILSQGLFPREQKTDTPGSEEKKKFCDKVKKWDFLVKNKKKWVKNAKQIENSTNFFPCPPPGNCLAPLWTAYFGRRGGQF